MTELQFCLSDEDLEVVTKGHTQTFFLKVKTRKEAEQLKAQILENQKLRKLIEEEVRRCFGELWCPKNEEYGTALQNLLKESQE